MRLLLTTLLLFACAAAIGLGATRFVADGGVVVGTVTIGAWTTRPDLGTPDIDPYARAALSRSGEMPFGSGEGLVFLARADDAGAPLDGRCEVVVAGPTPPARYWTLTLYDPEGGLVANPLGRHGFTSLEVLRASDGAFRIDIAPRARPGNWLPSGGGERYVLALRLLDASLGLTTQAGRGTTMPMPAITRGACP